MDFLGELQESLGSSYVLERELARGGMSRVFVAEDTALKRRVVVKVLPPELVGAVNIERFKREILVAAKLQHPHIVPIHSAGEMHGVPYFTMPFVEGESLRGRLARGPLQISELLTILRDVSRALAYAHEQGIVHRDIKPDNVLVSAGSASVSDFGIAKAISAARTTADDGGITAPGATIGTPAYMSPEQAVGDPDIDHRTDIYGFGCLAYELLTGRPPFLEKKPHKLLAAHMGDVPTPVGKLRPDASPVLAELVMRCLAKDPDARPQRAIDLVLALDNVTSGGAHAAMPAILLGGRAMLGKALAIYATSFVAVAIVARAAIVSIGLPDWVFPGALVVMVLGLPVILLTGYADHVARRVVTTTPMPPERRKDSQRMLHGLVMLASPYLSWRRATMGGVYAFGVFIGFIVLFMGLRALGIGPAGSLLAAGLLAQREPLLLTDFKVSNADSSLAPVVSDAVRAGLAESPVIALVPPATIAAALRSMERPPTTRLDLPLARELAQREGIKAVVDGEVIGLTDGYIVTVRLLSADSAVELASFRETGDGPRGLIDAADKAARALRGKIGESLRSVQASPPLSRATTASLDALRKYSEGVRANSIEGDPAKAVAALRRAVAIDSTFASAWRMLATTMRNARMPSASSDSAIERAYAFRSRLPDRERLNVEGTYFFWGPHRDREKAIAVLQTAIEQGDSSIAASNLGFVLSTRREFAGAESLFALGIRTAGTALFYTNALEMQLAQGNFSQASRTLATVRERFGETLRSRRYAFMLHYNRGDLAAARGLAESMQRSADRATATLGGEFIGSLALLDGRLAAARRALSENQKARAALGVGRSALLDSLDLLYVDVWYHPSAANVRYLDRLLAALPIRDVALPDRPYYRAASIYAIAGRPDKARQLLAQYRAEVTDTALRRLRGAESHLPQAEIALAERRPLDALAEFRAADRDYDGYPATDCAPCVAFNLARAFDAGSQPDSAIAMYEQFLAVPYYLRYLPSIDGIGRAAAHKRLGELYEAKDDPQRALSHYTAFVSLWKSADAELQPSVADVRRRMQRLGRT